MSCYWSFWCVFGHMRFRLYKSLNRLGHWPHLAHQIHQALLIMQCYIVLHFLIAFFVQDLFLLLPFWAWRSYCTLPTFYDEGRLMGIFWRLLVATKSCWQVTKAPRRAWIRMEEQAVARSKAQGGRVHQHGCQRCLRLCFNAGSSCITSTACRFAAMP